MERVPKLREQLGTKGKNMIVPGFWLPKKSLFPCIIWSHHFFVPYPYIALTFRTLLLPIILINLLSKEDM